LNEYKLKPYDKKQNWRDYKNRGGVAV
jgi:hypothetical protein